MHYFVAHNSTIHSIVGQRQPLLDSDPDMYKDWLKAASVAASVVQLLYQAFISKHFPTSFNEQRGRSRELLVLNCVMCNDTDGWARGRTESIRCKHLLLMQMAL
jgi:hypothetical protein